MSAPTSSKKIFPLLDLKTNQTQQNCLLYNRPIVPYMIAWEWQQNLVNERRHNPDLEDILILLEHPPVYTLGHGSKLEFLNFDPTTTTDELHRIERGGEVTYHCPGQLVGYPILNLKRHQPDLHWYLRQLEEVIIRVLDHYKLKGERIEGLTGVWVENRKVAAIGIKVSRWITMHGFALNINPNLEGFQKIIPCGIADKPMGSLAEFIPNIDPNSVRQTVATTFAEVFNLNLVEVALV